MKNSALMMVLSALVLNGCKITTGLRASSSVSAQAPAPIEGDPQPYGRADMLAPAMITDQMLPQNVALLGHPWQACEDAREREHMLSLEMKNTMDGFANVELDGQPLSIHSGRGVLNPAEMVRTQLPPLIPKRMSAYVCLNDIGIHTFKVAVYAERLHGSRGTQFVQRKLVKVCSFEDSFEFGPSPNGIYRQLMTIDFTRCREGAGHY